MPTTADATESDATGPGGTCADAPAEDGAVIDAYLLAYRPEGMGEAEWARIAPAAIALVRGAGPVTMARVASDIKAIGRMAVHLCRTGRECTLDEALSDGALLDFDQALGRAGRSSWTRAGRRATLRRLQARHHDAPWRGPRRPDGSRIEAMPAPALVDDLARLVRAAGESGTRGAQGLLLAVEHARQRRRRDRAELVPEPGPKTPFWRSARVFAAGLGVDLTRRMIDHAVMHEVLMQDAPLAVIATAFGMSRQDLDLGLAHAAALPAEPSHGSRVRLRG